MASWWVMIRYCGGQWWAVVKLIPDYCLHFLTVHLSNSHTQHSVIYTFSLPISQPPERLHNISQTQSQAVNLMISEYFVSYIKTKRVSLPGDDVMMLSALCCAAVFVFTRSNLSCGV